MSPLDPLAPGTKLFSAVCSTEFVVVKAPPDPVEVTIGGAPALRAPAGSGGAGPAAGHDGSALLGKRYVDPSGGLELLCCKAGRGLPAVGGTLMALKDPKGLPSSD